MLSAARGTFKGRVERSCTVTVDQSGVRIDRLLAELVKTDGISREQVKKMIQEGAVFVNNKLVSQAKFVVPPLATITFFLFKKQVTLVPEKEDVDVVYEDNFLAVINKPCGLTVHPCPSCPSGTLAHRLIHRFSSFLGEDDERPGIVHRLDKDTSGLLLVALNDKSQEYFAREFATRRVYKKYLALVYGVPAAENGWVDARIGRDPHNKTKMAVTEDGKEALTFWQALYKDPEGKFSLVAVRIFTGRTHQIRVHMAHIGYPLLGDTVYTPPLSQIDKGIASRDRTFLRKGIKDLAEEERLRMIAARKKMAQVHIPRQMLHAWQLAFFHPELLNPSAPVCKGGVLPDPKLTPESGETPLCFTQKPPADFMALVRSLVCGTQVVVITGSPGCGKSSLLKQFSLLGYPTISADAIVAELYAVGADGTLLLQARFGALFLNEKGAVDKTALGNAMQKNKAVKKEVEALLHPLVFHRVSCFLEKCRTDCSPFAFVEIPLFFETIAQETSQILCGSQERPVVIGVHASFATRSARLIKSRGWSLEKINAVESWQISEDEKMSMCDIVVNNDMTILPQKNNEMVDMGKEAAYLVERLFAIREERYIKVETLLV